MSIQTLLLLTKLPLPDDNINMIKIMYKYQVLEKTYKFRFNELNKHFLYYGWLNKKLNKQFINDNDKQTLLQTIKEFDYYKPNTYFKLKKPSAS